MSELHRLSLNHEELLELKQLLQSHLKSTMIEVRRSTPNSETKEYLKHRVEVIRKLLDILHAADHSEAESEAA